MVEGVLGYVAVPDDPNEAGDLVPTDRRRDDEIDRVIALGGTEIADRRNRDGTGWMVLSDPEGNHFCILRSDEERAETPS